MSARPNRCDREILRVFNMIKDEKVRYFYMMLGEAMGESGQQGTGNGAVQTNTGPRHLADLTRRLNSDF